MKVLLTMTAFAALQNASGGGTASPGEHIFSSTGYVENAGDNDGGWFQFVQSAQRFRLPAAGAETYVNILVGATQRGVALRVRYDVSAARVNQSGGYVEYPICSLSVMSGASFGDERANCPAPAGAVGPQTGEGALALGLAMAGTQPEAARRLLAQALADRGLAPALRQAALRARGEAAEQIAFLLPWAGEAYDRGTADALADFRAWVAAAPDEPEAQYATARALGDLGAYEDMLAIYRTIGLRWPNEAFHVAVRSGAVYRRQGHYQQALRALDDYASRAGPQQGMKFHYHRAWTLNLLNRPNEALEDLRQGLASQPDYPYAYFMRACANAKLGRIADALADQQTGLELMTGASQDNPTLYADELDVARTALQALRTLAATSAAAPSDVPCRHLWEHDERPRARSPLLGPTAG